MISIIIVTYNSDRYIDKCLKSILRYKQKINLEIIVIDNNSTDNTVNRLIVFLNEIKLIENNNNVGFAKACNYGIENAKGEFVFILNPDTELLNNALEVFYKFMTASKNNSVWCVGAQLFDERGFPSKSYGRFPTMFDVILEQSGLKGIVLKYLFKDLIELKRKSTKDKVVPYIIGANMFIRVEALKKFGVFDERFFLNYEETELSWRAKQAGYTNTILPQAEILHYSGKSFTNLEQYKKHLWIGQLQYFKLTKARIIFLLCKFMHLLGSLFRMVIKQDVTYKSHFAKIKAL